MTADTVLIVDDDKFIRTILKDALAGRYTTLEADNGQTALDLLSSTLPDLVILDIEMPVIGGIEVCKIIKENEQAKRIPVILITAHTNRDEIILGMQTGADDYITKPVHPPEVLARVDAHLLYKNYYNELERRDLQMLLELYDIVTVLRNPMKILRFVVEKIAEVIEVERCSIISINDVNEIVVKACNDLQENTEIRLDLNRYPEIRKAIETHQAVIVNDVKSDLLMEPVRQHVEALKLNSLIVVPIIKKEAVIGTLLLRTTMKLRDGISERISKLTHLVANISANALENATLFESMQSAKELFEEMAIRDGLSMLYTHRHFYERLEKEFSRAIRHEESLSLIFFDIDNFKQVNDKYGHIRGDEVIRQIGVFIREFVREIDIAARYGGEEFVILLPKTEAVGALELARRIGSTIRSFRYKGMHEEQITISAGIATFPGNGLHSFTQLVDQANQLMFRAKSEGKDRIATTDQNIAVNQSQAVT